MVSSKEGRSKEGRSKEGRSKETRGKKQATPTSEGYRKLFINLGKKDGFYPGELMQFLNKNIHGHVEVGHIDLLQTMSYFEVPEEDAPRVMKYLDGQHYKGRDVRCNDAAEGGKAPAKAGRGAKPARNDRPAKAERAAKGETPGRPGRTYRKEEWMQFLNPKSMKDRELKGEIPDFSEEGWAIRKPRKK